MHSATEMFSDDLCPSVLHIASNTGVSINPPGTSDARLTIKDAELVEAQLLFQSASHRNARLACANDRHGYISNGIFIIAIESTYRIVVLERGSVK